MHLKGRSLVCDRSCLLRCSLLLNALLQNWHLYFRSGCATADFREAGAGVGAAVGRTATFAPGILSYGCRVGDSTGKKGISNQWGLDSPLTTTAVRSPKSVVFLTLHRLIVEIAWLLARTRAPVGFKVCLLDWTVDSWSFVSILGSWNEFLKGCGLSRGKSRSTKVFEILQSSEN